MPVIYIERSPPTCIDNVPREICFIDMINDRFVLKYTPTEVIFRGKDFGVVTHFTYKGTREDMRLIYQLATALFDIEVDWALGKIPEKSHMVLLALEKITGTVRHTGPGYNSTNQVIKLAITAAAQDSLKNAMEV